MEVLGLTADMHSNIAQTKQRINTSGTPLADYFRFVDL